MPHVEAEHRPEGHRDSELIDALEPDQLADVAARPLPRAQINRSGELALWALRIFVLVITGLVVYTFVAQLMQRP